MRTLLICLSLALPGAAFGVPLSYDEAVSGDIVSASPFVPGPPNPGPLFALDAGVNTVVGRMSYGIAAANQDFDFFRIVLPAGTSLTAASLAWSSYAPDGQLSSATIGPFVLAGSGGARSLADPASIELVVANVGNRALWSRDLPLGAGTYELAHVIGIGRAQDQPGTRWSLDYAWTFTVAPATVPEPATALLLAFGLLATAAARGRRAPRPC